MKSKFLSICGLEYVLTSNGAVALRDVSFAARHPSLARLARGVGVLGMWLGALNPGLALSGQQYHPEAATATAAGAVQADAPAQYRVRKHLARAAPAPQPAYVVPISDTTELGIANLDTTDAQIAVYSSATPTLQHNDTWAQVLVSPGVVLDTAVPVRLTVPAGGFARMTPQAGLFAVLSVSGATPGLVHVIAEHTQTVNGHVLTETIPASSLDDMIPAGGDGFLPGPIDITYDNMAPGVLQGFAIVAGAEPAAIDVAYRDSSGGNPVVLLHYDLDAWGSVRAPDFWRAWGRGPPNGPNSTLDILPTSGAVLAYDLLTDTVSGKQATLPAGQNTSETDFAFIAQRLGTTKLTEPHAINPSDKLVLFLPQLQPRDTITPPIPSIITAQKLLDSYWHWAWPDVVTSLLLPNTSYDVNGIITGHGALYDKTKFLRDFVDGPHVPLLVWNHLQTITPYGDVGQWVRALYPPDACGGAQQMPCSAIGITPLTRILLANVSVDSLPVSMDFYDATGSRISTEQKTLRQNENTALEGIVPPGAVRVMSSTPAWNTGTYYVITQTRTAGDCEDYQAGKPLPGS